MLNITLNNFDPYTIAESGQCFRMHKDAKYENQYFLIANNNYLIIKQNSINSFSFSTTTNEWDNFYYNYFDFNTDYEKIKNIALKEDIFLQKCINYGKNIRILKQDPFEMLISFIISQRKSVPAIRTSIERLCERASKKKTIKSDFTNEKITFYPFPTVKEILDMPKSLLDECGLGYRKEYIIRACESILNNEIDLEKISLLGDNELLEALQTIKGVGIKVASCIALFAYHRFSILPIDVWIKRVIENKYNNSIPKEYLPYIGVIQQFWFNYARIEKLK